MECPVCFGPSDMKTLCGHEFCKSCISQTIDISLACPLCRGLLIDEPVAIKALNECIRKSLHIASTKTRQRYWKKYNQFKDDVVQGNLDPEQMGHSMISYLMTIVGNASRTIIKLEMYAAVAERNFYLLIPYDDWRSMFL